MTWINLPSVSVQSGSKTVTVSNAQTTNIKVGDALLIGNYQPVEISGVFATQLTLRENWSNANQNHVVAVVMPTSGDFVTATKVLKEATETTRSNFAALEKWATQMGTVEFKGQDNTPHTGRTFKQMDEDVKALETGLSTVVANKIAEVVNVDWDLFIPFNDSGRIERGFGEHDTIDVGGSIIELPTKSVSFSRASARTVVNKSGEVEFVGADKLAIGRDGAEFYQEYTNYQLNSERPSEDHTTGWTVRTYGTGSLPVITNNYGLAPSGEQTAARVQFALNGGTTDQDQSNLVFIPVSLVAGDTITGSLWIKSNTGLTYTMRFDFNGGSTVAGTELIEITPEWKRYDITYVGIDGPGSTRSPYLRLRGAKGTSDSADILVWGAQVTKTSQPMPYIKTEASAVTSVADTCELPVRNNLPRLYSAFSVLIDARIGPFIEGTSGPHLFRAYGISNASVYIRRNSSGSTVLAFYDGTNTSTIYFSVDESLHRIVFTYENRTAKIWVDGVEVGSNENISVGDFYHADGTLVIGGKGGLTRLNGAVKNFGIIHRALSDDEIKALGAAK